MKIKFMTLCAVFAALLCVCSVITIPTGIVPVTLSLFGIMLAVGILGLEKATVSVTVFLLLGAVGLPVFSGFKGGFAVLLGPTGGYIWSYIPMVVLTSLLTLSMPKNKWLAMLRYFVAFVAGVALVYVFGTVQFCLVQSTDWRSALSVCVIPFIPFDLAKAVVASYLSYAVKRALVKAKML